MLFGHYTETVNTSVDSFFFVFFVYLGFFFLRNNVLNSKKGLSFMSFFYLNGIHIHSKTVVSNQSKVSKGVDWHMRYDLLIGMYCIRLGSFLSLLLGWDDEEQQSVSSKEKCLCSHRVRLIMARA